MQRSQASNRTTSPRSLGQFRDAQLQVELYQRTAREAEARARASRDQAFDRFADRERQHVIEAENKSVATCTLDRWLLQWTQSTLLQYIAVAFHWETR